MKRFTATFVAVIAATLLALSSYAQECPEKDRIVSEKIAYFTSELQLTPEEAQQFWPVYNQLWAQKKELHKISREKMHEMRDAINKGASDKEIERLFNEYMLAMDNCDDFRKKTRDELMKVLPVAKTAKVFCVEESFMMKQMRQLKGKKK